MNSQRMWSRHTGFIDIDKVQLSSLDGSISIIDGNILYGESMLRNIDGELVQTLPPARTRQRVIRTVTTSLLSSAKPDVPMGVPGR